MRLQMVSLPDIVDGGLAHPLGLGEQPTTPLGHASRLGAQRRRHDRRDLAPPVAWLAAPARGHFPQTVQALLRKALAPQRDRLAIDLTSSGNGIVGLPFSRRKHNPTPQGNLLWGTEGRHPLPQLLFICLFELQRWRRSRHPFIIVRPCGMSSYLLDTLLAAYGEARRYWAKEHAPRFQEGLGKAMGKERGGVYEGREALKSEKVMDEVLSSETAMRDFDTTFGKDPQARQLLNVALQDRFRKTVLDRPFSERTFEA